MILSSQSGSCAVMGTTKRLACGFLNRAFHSRECSTSRTSSCVRSLAPLHASARRASLVRRHLGVERLDGGSCSTISHEVKQPLAAMTTRSDTDLKSHRILAKVERSAWPLRVMGDQIQVQQVLLNLITNAIEAMATVDGPRVLAVSSSRRDDGGVMISVSDTGTGIDAQDDRRASGGLQSDRKDQM